MTLLRGRDASRRRKGITLKDAAKLAKEVEVITPNFATLPSQMDSRLKKRIRNGVAVLSGTAWEAMRRRSTQQGAHPSPKGSRSKNPRPASRPKASKRNPR